MSNKAKVTTIDALVESIAKIDRTLLDLQRDAFLMGIGPSMDYYFAILEARQALSQPFDLSSIESD